MKHRYVIDLSVAHCAQTLRDDKGGNTRDGLELLTTLIGNCHSLFTCPTLGRGYSKLADELKQSGEAQGQSIFGLARSAMAVAGKWEHPEEPPELPDETSIPADDRILIRLAVAANAHLITTDGRLIKAVRKSRILEPHGLLILDVKEGLKHVAEL